MPSMRKVLTSPRFSTEATATHLNFDAANRSVTVGRAGSGARGYVGRIAEASKGKNIFDSAVLVNTKFPSVIGVFGMRGTGKSFDLGVLAECLADSAQSDESKLSSPPAIVIFDVQNQFWTLSIAPSEANDAEHIAKLAKWHLSPREMPNVCCWSPTGMQSYVPGAREYRISPEQLSESDWLALLEQERYSAPGQALLALLQQTNDHNPSTLAANARPGSMLSSFQPQTIDALRWRLEAASKTGLISAPGIGIDELLVPGRISVILLRDLPDSMRALTAATLVRLLAARMTDFHQQIKLANRGKIAYPQENLPQQLWVMLDEAHVIAPNESKTPANQPLVDYVKRGRDSGLSLVFATQQPSAVDDKLMSQVDMTFTHALGFEADVQAAVARMPTRKPATYKCGGESLSTSGDIIRSLNPGEAVIADSANQRPFIACIRPRLSVHGGETPG